MPVNSRMTAFAGSGIILYTRSQPSRLQLSLLWHAGIFSCEQQEDCSFGKVMTTWNSSASYTLPTDVPGGTLVPTLAGCRALLPL